MPIRGTEYLRWIAEGKINAQHDQILPGGAHLNVESRMKPHGVCEIAVCLYARNGTALYEEMFGTLHDSPAAGLKWGIQHGIDEFGTRHVHSLQIKPPQEL